jgi:hypothetical protein
VDTGSRQENASKQRNRASVPIQSERKRLQRRPHVSKVPMGDIVDLAWYEIGRNGGGFRD